MVDYRAILRKKEDQDSYLKRYKWHLDAYGGIFTPDKRSKLIGINPTNPQPYKDTPNFWLDVRNSVKNSLTDLQLICEVAHSEQLKKMFQLIPPKYYSDPPTPPSLDRVLISLLETHKEDYENKENVVWRAELAIALVRICLKFFKGNHFITSSMHDRTLSEVLNLLQSELSYAKLRIEKQGDKFPHPLDWIIYQMWPNV